MSDAEFELNESISRMYHKGLPVEKPKGEEREMMTHTPSGGSMAKMYPSMNKESEPSRKLEPHEQERFLEERENETIEERAAKMYPSHAGTWQRKDVQITEREADKYAETQERFVENGRVVLRDLDTGTEKIVPYGSLRAAVNAGSLHFLNSIDLQGADFHSLSITDMDFEHSDLRGCSFKNAEAKGANFDNTILGPTTFDGANLTAASFRNCDLRRCTFRGCDMQGVNLEGAQLPNSDAVRGARWSGAAPV